MRTRITVLLALLVGSTQGLPGQQPPTDQAAPVDQGATAIFRSGVESVRLDVIVTDRRGNPVTDLLPGDFEVRESGVPQRIQQFSHVFVPAPSVRRVRAGQTAVPPPPPETGVNLHAQDRIYVIVLGYMSWQQGVRATQIVDRFLDSYFGDRDIASVVALDSEGPMRFTSSRAVLRGEVDTIIRRRADTTLAIQRPANPLARMHYRDELDRARVFGDIARALADVEGQRKSIIYIGSNLWFDPYDAIDMPRSSFSEVARAAMEPILAGNLAVYPLYPGGVRGPMDNREMRALAYVSGGVPTGTDIDRSFRQMVRDNSAYYVLGYDSTHTNRDGGYRRIQVKVHRRDVTVRTRDGYFVEFPPDPNPDRLFSWSGRTPPARTPAAPAPPRLTAEMTRALASPVPLTTVPMQVVAAAHRTASREASVSVVVEIDPRGLDLTPRDGTLGGQLQVAIDVTSGGRSQRGTQHTFDVALRGEARSRATGHGLRATSELRLPPGQYTLHVAAGTGDDRAGKVIHAITVPDFTASSLMMSDLSLTSDAAAAVPTFQPRDLRASGLPLPASGWRDFSRDDTLVVYAELYQNARQTGTGDPPHVTAELRTAEGRVVASQSATRSSSAPRLDDGAFPFAVRLPLRELPAGTYVVRVEGRVETGTTAPVMREVGISVR